MQPTRAGVFSVVRRERVLGNSAHLLYSEMQGVSWGKEGTMNHVTLINPFEVPAGNEDEFVERWKQAASYLR